MESQIHKVLCWIAVLIAIPVLKWGASVFVAIGLAVIAFHPFLPWFKELLPEDAREQRSVKATGIVSLILMSILSAVAGMLVWSGWYGLNQHELLVPELRSSFEGAVGSQYVDGFLSLAGSWATQLFPIFPGIAIFIFIAWEYPRLRSLIVERFVEGDRSEVLRDFEEEGSILRKFWVSQTLGGFVTGLTVGIVLWLMGVPLAWLWGVTTFLLNYIPTVGSVVGFLVPVGFALAVDTGVSAVQVALAVGLIEIIYGVFVGPLIHDHFLPLSSLTVIVAITFWGWMWGPWGALIGVPLTYTLGKFSLFHPVYNSFGKLVIQNYDQ